MGTLATAGPFLPWPDGHRATADALRASVPSIAEETVLDIRRELPEYVRPHDARYAATLELGVRYAIGQFVELVNDPSAPTDEVVAFFRDVGYGEALEGRSLEPLRLAVRRGAKTAVRRLSEAASGREPDLPSPVYSQVIDAIFPYLDLLDAAAARGHAEGEARTEHGLRRHRRLLLDLLIADPPPTERSVRAQARWAGWHPARTVAAVALHPRGDRTPATPPLGPDVLDGLHLNQPCLIVPDPEGPGRRQALEAALRGWIAVLGPAGAVTELGPSLRWARHALSLARRGALPSDGLLDVADHMPTLVITQGHDLVGRVAARRLAPLERVRSRQRRRLLAETLVACLECGFNSARVAERVHLHPQTVRYRLRTLEDLFGQVIYDPAHSLELQMVLRAWLADNPASESGQDAAPETAAPARTDGAAASRPSAPDRGAQRTSTAASTADATSPPAG
ncbi:PucR family transcriptional regulator [Actinomadura yumaensis]|uniref:PucR family transcriptional regulator n=1 Tax=Actinomadura yumaensis TaxID=111807 RepID=A0ABW2CS89_9ACTN